MCCAHRKKPIQTSQKKPAEPEPVQQPSSAPQDRPSDQYKH